MSFYRYLAHTPDTTFPDRMLSPRSKRGTTREIVWLLSGLFLLTLLPRAITAWQLGSVCNDAHYYIWLADALEQGDFQTAVVSYLNVNIYPVILMMMHQLGFDWVTGGQIWSVLASSLIVFPMFGWIREQYNEQIATAACFLYAVHPELIEWSAEPVRSPTFWLMATCSVYFLWRSMMGLKYRSFILAGLALALAIHTRSEGWLLLFLLVGWTFFRYRLLETGRRRLLIGSALSLAMIPLFVLLMNVTVLRHHTQWELGRYTHFEECSRWVSKTLGTSNVVSESTANHSKADHIRSHFSTPEAFGSSHPMHPLVLAEKRLPSTEKLFYLYQQKFTSAMGSFTLIFLAVGLFVMFRDIFHRDKCLYLPLMLLLMFGIWIRLSGSGEMSSRFFLLAYFLVIPCEAIGFLFLIHQIIKLCSRFTQHATFKPMVASCFIVALVVFGWADALSSHDPKRSKQVQFGNWLKKQYGEVQSIVAEKSILRTGHLISNKEVYNSNSPDELWGLLERKQPEMVILSSQADSKYAQQWRTEMTHFFAERAMSPVSMEGAPESSRDFLVFIKTKTLLAKRKTSTPHAVSGN